MRKVNSNFETFVNRHVGLTPFEEEKILTQLGYSTLQEFIASVVPKDILESDPISELFIHGCSEANALSELTEIASKNVLRRSLIGLGYYGTKTPSVVQRQIFENPSWYTSYTPYQAEIAQGRLEALFNFQTLISELTGLPIANASLLDEATAAAEAMSLSYSITKKKSAKKFLVDKFTFPQTLSVLQTRADSLNINLQLFDPFADEIDEQVFGIYLQIPACNGHFWDPSICSKKAKDVNAIVTIGIDPLAQVLLKPIGDLGADIAIGSMQRFGVPIGFGGPHAAFFATKESFKRQIPGRLVGQSVDKDGKPALRLALQTREQHIRRDKATSNICTAQVLLAIISSFYAVYHGKDGLELIAKRVSFFCRLIEQSLRSYGYNIEDISRFDTIDVFCEESKLIHLLGAKEGFNFKILPLGSSIDESEGFGISIDELTTVKELNKLSRVFADAKAQSYQEIIISDIEKFMPFSDLPLRNKPWLTQPVFNIYRSETELLRYIHRLANKDFSLSNGMIPLGSCTMKLNAASQLIPVGWNEFSLLHPFVPDEQCLGYQHLIDDLEKWLAILTGFKGVSLQPNAGSQGEYAGLLVIKAWHKFNNQINRNICLIPTSAHGTNPASAVMAGMKVVPVKCDLEGNIDFKDLKEKIEEHSNNLAALMVTYPSTHGVFEEGIGQICQLVHLHGGQVYLDGANLNAQVGICRPGKYGADVCHLNLHKTFCIPHGGGGPGIGPIAVAEHLTPFLPGHPFKSVGGLRDIGAIAAAPYGSASILPISWMYIRMMGAKGLTKASSLAILSANYLANRLTNYFPILFKGANNRVAHECILDLRPIKNLTGIEVEDIAKRLMDYGFHAPTVSWPVAGTMMVEPTESESLGELDRFCDAMIGIREEIRGIESGEFDSQNNPIKLSPHTLEEVTKDNWDKPYSRQVAAFPLPNQIKNKFWPAVSRINNAFGDRNLVCACTPVKDFETN